jgi:RNA polymerase sigma factor (sigma-70 family)
VTSTPGMVSLARSVTQAAIRPVIARAMNDTAAVLNPAPANKRHASQQDVDALYRKHNARLLRAVRMAVTAPAETIEDACSFAWLQLMRTEPDTGPTIFAWLRTVAVREAIRLAKRDARFGHNEAEQNVDTRLPDLETVVEAKEAVRSLSALRQRQSRILMLHLSGYSYQEIAERTGNTVRTVERQLLRGRKRLRSR